MTGLATVAVAKSFVPTPAIIIEDPPPAAEELLPEDRACRRALEEAFGKASWDSANLAELFVQQQASRQLVTRVLVAGARVYWLPQQSYRIRDNIELISWLQTMQLTPLQATMVLVLQSLASEYASGIEGRANPKNRRAAVRKSEHALVHARCLLSCTAWLGLNWPFLIRRAAEHFHFDAAFVRHCESAIRSIGVVTMS